MLSFAEQPPSLVYWSLRPQSPAGPLLIGATANGQLCRVGFLKSSSKSRLLADWQKKWPRTQFIEKKTARKKNGGDILLIGTKFQRKVWAELMNIPRGQTISYGEMARRIGNPKAARAVGGALAANPVPFFVPCHRVVARDGSLGGFCGGQKALDLKEALLKSEGVAFG